MSEKCLCLWSHVAGLLPKPYIVDPKCPIHNRSQVTYPDVAAITQDNETWTMAEFEADKAIEEFYREEP